MSAGGAVPAGIMAVLRLRTRADAETAVHGLARTSVDVIELTLTTPDALAVLSELRAVEPARTIFAGTVMTTEQVRACHAAGIDGIVSPHLDPALVALALELGLAVVPGALTATEVVAAHALGASAVKIFPIGLVGGPAYIRALREPLPQIALVPSGRVQTSEVGEYLAAGSRTVCMGGALLDADAIARHDPDGVAEWAEARLAEARRPPVTAG